MAVRSEYPIDGDPIVRGDPLAIALDVRRKVAGVVTPIDVSEWVLRAHIRRSPDATLITEFDIDVITPDGGTVPSTIVLRLSAEQTRLLKTGYTFDLEQLVDAATPTSLRTLWICTKMNVVKDVSHQP